MECCNLTRLHAWNLMSEKNFRVLVLLERKMNCRYCWCYKWKESREERRCFIGWEKVEMAHSLNNTEEVS
jgi:hypothetical protein